VILKARVTLRKMKLLSTSVVTREWQEEIGREGDAEACAAGAAV